jgi:ATP-dependent Clp protease adaptor protein ClpS
MLQTLFGYPPEKGFQMAKEVDSTGRVILLTTTKEHAELKQEQIHAFGPDPLLERCQGSMTAVIEPAV